MMTAAERVARLTPLLAQIQQLNDDLARLEREDEGFAGYRQRAQAANRPPIAYAEFARYDSAREQLETAWTNRGRPASWDQLALLNRLPDMLVIQPVVASAPASPAPPAAPAAAAQVVRPTPAPPVAPPPAPVAAAPPAPVAAAPPAPVAAAPPAPPPPAAEKRSVQAVAEVTVSHSQLVEMHSPILNEVGDLTKRAEEEFRMSQIANGLVSVDRATYLLERVAHAPPAMCQRLLRVLDEGMSKGGQQSDADRARREQVRSRLVEVLEAER